MEKPEARPEQSIPIDALCTVVGVTPANNKIFLVLLPFGTMHPNLVVFPVEHPIWEDLASQLNINKQTILDPSFLIGKEINIGDHCDQTK